MLAVCDKGPFDHCLVKANGPFNDKIIRLHLKVAL